MSERQELVDVYEEIHGVFAENIVSDLLTEVLLSLRDGGGQGYTQRPVRLTDLLPGRLGPQLGSDEAEQGGEKPLGADRLQQVRDDGVVVQRLCVAEWLEWLSLHTRVLGSILGRGTM